MKKYRLIEGYGQYWNKRWEVQESYTYIKNGELIHSWYPVFNSSDKNRAREVLNKYKNNPPKRYKLSLNDNFNDNDELPL